MPKILKFPNKYLRARAIAPHIEKAGYEGAVIFTCGNAAEELRRVTSKRIVEIGPRGELQTSLWWTPSMIHAAFPALYDATSGHQPLPLMIDISKKFKEYLYYHTAHDDSLFILKQTTDIFVPTGSGETVLCLAMAFPHKKFTPIYDNSNPATTRNPECPLNEIVDAQFYPEDWTGRLAKEIQK